MRKLAVLSFIALGVTFAGTSFAFPSCGTGQIAAGSLTDCTAGVEDFSNWVFTAPGYTGTATVQIDPGADPLVDPYIVTLRFSQPIQTAFTLDFTATVNSPLYANQSIVQEMLAGNLPNNSAVTGTYNGMMLTTDGNLNGYYAQGSILPSPVLTAALSGTGAPPAPPPACVLCGGGPVQKVDINIYLGQGSGGPAVPEPLTMALTGFGLVGLAAALRRKKRS